MIVMQNKTCRNVLRWLIPVLGIPALTFIGSWILKGKYYLPVAMLGALLSFLLFVAGFEKKRTGTRRIVIVSVMTALCFIGRFLPFLKPMTAITIITAIYLGRESGFLTGALSALLSNFYFGQGPWTIFQMMTWGLLGWLAGILAEPLKRHRSLLLVYGVTAGILYSFCMDIWTVLWYAGEFDSTLYASALVTAIPYTLSYILSNLIFLTLLEKPIGEKLERIRIKYGI